MDPISLIAAGGSLLSGIGGLFGSKKKKTEKTIVENHVDYAKMSEEAQAAGFNPLTALRNGGAAGFSVSSQSHPGLSANPLVAIGDTMQNVSRAVTDYDDSRVAQANASAQRDLVAAQLANIQADTRLKLRSLDVPMATGSRHRVGGAELGSSGVGGGTVNDPARVPEPGKVQATNPFSTGLGLEVNPNVPDTEMAESRYGDSEINSMIFGAGTMLADAAWNANRGVQWLSKKFDSWGIPTDSQLYDRGASAMSRWFGGPSLKDHLRENEDFYKRQRGSYP